MDIEVAVPSRVTLPVPEKRPLLARPQNGPLSGTVNDSSALLLVITPPAPTTPMPPAGSSGVDLVVQFMPPALTVNSISGAVIATPTMLGRLPRKPR